MAMLAGTVTVADDESATGTGAALAMYNADLATRTLPAVPALGSTAAPFSPARPVLQSDIDLIKAARLVLLREAARLATAYAAVVTHIATNGSAVVRVAPLGDGLQRTPSPNNPDVNTKGPINNVYLPLE